MTGDIPDVDAVFAEAFGELPPPDEIKCFRCSEAVYIDDAGIARHVKRGACEVPTIRIEGPAPR